MYLIQTYIILNLFEIIILLVQLLFHHSSLFVRGVIGDDFVSMSNKFLAKLYMMIEKYYLTKTDKVLANGWDTQ